MCFLVSETQKKRYKYIIIRRLYKFIAPSSNLMAFTRNERVASDRVNGEVSDAVAMFSIETIANDVVDIDTCTVRSRITNIHSILSY